VLALGLSIGACAAIPQNKHTDVPPKSVAETPSGDAPQDRPAPAVPREPPAAAQAGAPATEIVRGTGRFYAPPVARRTQARAPAPDDATLLNFVNADIRDVAKAVLGDFLKLNYQIAGNVQGTITIQTNEPVDRKSALSVLEQALRLNGIAIVRTGDYYKILPLAEAQRENPVVTPETPRVGGTTGYGVEIVGLKYMGAKEMIRLIEPLTPLKDSVHGDEARNLLFIQGTEQERALIKQNIALFDVDWLKGMSFALFQPRYTDADGLTKELEQIFGGQAGPLGDMVKLVPVSRLNAVLAISPQSQYLDEVQAWIGRLDRPGEGSDQRIWVYRVQNGRAADLAGVLTKVLSKAGPRLSVGDASAPAAAVGISDAGSFKGLSVTADDVNNALVVLATPQEYQIILAALGQLDSQPLQVLLEAVIAEVTLTDELKYGVQYFYKSDSKRTFALSKSGSTAIGPSLPGFAYSFIDGANIKIILDALASVTHVDVLSSPQVLVLNNQTAILQVGSRIPIITQQAVSTLTADSTIVNSVQYQDTGVILKVLPRVNQGGLVLMDVTQEVSSVTATTTSTIDSPTIQQRKISSSVAVQDGATIALGGLITVSKTRSRSGIPILQSLPFIGAGFRSTERDISRTELIVLITPHVVNNLQRALAVTEELRQKLPAVRPLLEHRP
jgi:general secretion pathway protein D